MVGDYLEVGEVLLAEVSADPWSQCTLASVLQVRTLTPRVRWQASAYDRGPHNRRHESARSRRPQLVRPRFRAHSPIFATTSLSSMTRMVKVPPKKAPLVLLTWPDVVRAAADLTPELRDLALRLVPDTANQNIASASDITDGRWFLRSIEVRGHVGIGESRLVLKFDPVAGIIFISARNGVGKTSCADAMRHVLSGGGARHYDLTAANIHYGHREIRAVITDGRQDVQVSCSGDGTVAWQGGADAVEVPAEWISAYQQYRPVLLYPEISPIIEKPAELHEFLRDGLETEVLSELQRRVDHVRETGRNAARRIEASFKSVQPHLTEGVLPDSVRTAINGHGCMVPTDVAETIRTALEEAPLEEQSDGLVADWSVDTTAVDNCVQTIENLRQAQAAVIPGAGAVHQALENLLDGNNEFLHNRDADVCPVCGSESADWRAHARIAVDALARDLQRVHSTERAAKDAIKGLMGILPPQLPPQLHNSLAQHDQSHLIAQWDALIADGSSLTVASATGNGIRDIATRSATLAAAYQHFKAQKVSEQRTTLASRARALHSVESWLTVVETDRTAAAAGALADKLAKWVDQRIKDTRAALFEPIAAQVREIWSQLNADSDLQVTDLRLAGGTRAAKRVEIGLKVGGVSVLPDTKTPSILSTGQRNALTLATYFPRATQPQSPFRFLILDDPVHAFDSWRVRYLAERLRQMANDYQIVVFSHDERLWSELQRHGQIRQSIRLDRPHDRPSTVRATEKSSGILLLEDLEGTLNAEEQSPVATRQATTAMTLAMCRLALDVEVGTQIEILGRRAGMSDASIDDARGRARDTRKQIALLNEYATRAGCPTVVTGPFEKTIDALNAGAHGRAPAARVAQRRRWIEDVRKLIRSAHDVTA